MQLSVSKSSNDGYAWRCRRTETVHNKKKKCETELTIRAHWLAYHNKLPLVDILSFVYLWNSNVALKISMNEARIGSNSTAVRLARTCRGLLVEAYMQNCPKLGGVGKVVSNLLILRILSG
jgi:hypothetical protein